MRPLHFSLIAFAIVVATYLDFLWVAALLGAVLAFGLLGTVLNRVGRTTGGLAHGLGEDVEREYAAFEGAHGSHPDPELLPDMVKAVGGKTAEYWWNRKQGATEMNPAQPYADDTHRNTSKYLGSRVITGSTRLMKWLVERVFHMGHVHGHEGELHKGVAAEAAAEGGGAGHGDAHGAHGGGHGEGHGSH